jgi:hypothetical protein
VIGPAHVLAVALVMAGTSGCSLLDLLLGTGFGPLDPGGEPPFPTASATFTSGTATIKLADQTIVLDELAGAAGVDVDLGTHVAWENEDGWYLTYVDYSDDAFPGSAYLTIDRIFEHEHWVIADSARCLTTTTQSGRFGVKGSATCRGAEWTDFFNAYSFTSAGLPEPIAGEPAFDAEITFEAR